VATRRGRPLDPTHREFELLEVFARHPGQVLSRDQLLTQVWG
jgi:DNA-binding response OmpR family regulator